MSFFAITRLACLKYTALLLAGLLFAFAAPAQDKQISFTFDDGVTEDRPGYAFEEWNRRLLDHLSQARVKAIFFVTSQDKTTVRGRALLTSWSRQGHRLANHTATHPNYNREQVTFEDFRREFLRNDSLIRTYPTYVRLFRFPYLKEGNTPEKVNRFRQLLREHHYRNGYVTIDASDWYIDSRLLKRLKENPDADLAGFRQYYLQHLLERANYYEDLAFQLTGRHIPHTILLHHNLAAALFLGDAIDMFRAQGWRLIDANRAYRDPVYRQVPATAGEGLIWALAKQSGRFAGQLRYPAENSTYEKEAMDKLGL